MEKVLIITSVASMVDQFMLSNIELLQQMGLEVHVACNFLEGNTCTEAVINRLKIYFDKSSIKYYQVDFSRNIFNLNAIRKAYCQLNKILKADAYKFVHCHSPIGGMLGRIAGKRNRVAALYTAHGFHFYKGSGLKAWLFYYPIELFMSFWTDALITINEEDFDAARKKLHAKKTYYVPGVGIELNKYGSGQCIEREGIDCLFLSVGELNSNKNHKIIIKALSELKSEMPGCRFQYWICGQGPKYEELKQLITDLDLNENVKLLGFRENIREIYRSADVFLFPSYREGLSVALMEAMASGLPVICSDIRGNRDLIMNHLGGYLVGPENLKDFKECIKGLIASEELRQKFGMYNETYVRKFSVENVNEKLKEIYQQILCR